MKKFFVLIVSIALFSSSVFGAVVGQEIKNSAFVSYNIGGVDKNQTTNEVVTKIAKTPATIEFYSYNPNEAKQNLEPTYYIDKDGNKILVDKTKLPDGTEVTTPSTLGMQKTSNYMQNDLIIIKVTDLDQDVNASTQESIEIEIVNPYTGDREKLILRESSPNSGEFIGFIRGSSESASNNDGKLSLRGGNKITALYNDNGTNVVVEAKAVVATLSSRLIATKKQSKSVASVGEHILYTVTLENISKIDLKNVTINDTLPNGLKYVKGSFKVAGIKAEPTISQDGKTLSTVYANLAAHSTVEITYVALIGAGTGDEAINRAWGATSFGTESNIATTKLKIEEDLYRSKGYILGQVYDANIAKDVNNTKDSNSSAKYGIEGVRVYMEDGRYSVTDKQGKYHFVNVANGTHVVQIDTESFKGRYRVAKCIDNTRFADSNISQFVELYHGELKRADFCLEKIAKKVGKSELNLSVKKVSSKEVELTIKLASNQKLKEPVAVLELSEGLEYEAHSTSNNIEAEVKDNLVAVALDDSGEVSLTIRTLPGAKPTKSIAATLIYNLQLEKNLKSDTAIVEFNTGGKLNQEIAKIVKANDSVKMTDAGGKAEPKDGDYAWSKPTHQEHMPKYSPESIDTLGQSAKLLWPPKGWVPDIPSTRVAVLTPKRCAVELRLNGHKVDMVHYEGIFRSKNHKMQIIHFKGIDLANGENRFEAIVKKRGKVIDRLSRVIYVESHAPASAEFLPEYSYLKADGKHSPIIAVRFRGKSGHLLRGGLVGSYTVIGGYSPQTLSNGKGQYRIDSKGIAYIRLKPTTKVGELTLKFSNALQVKTKLKPYLRDWILVGFAKGTVGYDTISSHTSSDGKDKLYHKGRVAFFAKGRIKGKWLATIAYDSGKEKRELFDTIDPDKYYKIYQDNSVQKNEAPSTKKLYVKLEKDDFYALFGDFNTGFSGTEFANYSRSFTGLKSEYSNKNIKATIFVAKSDKLFFRDDILGDGTSGYYKLSHQNIIEGSEKITIEVRQKHHEENILESRELSRYKDYDIDYDKGTIYFKEPILSQDREQNPRYIVAKYELKGDKGSHYTYGARVAYNSSNKKYQVGATYINEDSGTQKTKLYGIDAKVKINKKLDFKAEIAHSKSRKDGTKSEGNAYLAELKYHHNKTTARAYIRKQDKAFGLNQLSKDLGATRKIGLEIEQKVNKKVTLKANAYQNRTDDGNTSQDEKVLELATNYRTKVWNNSIGYRYAKSSGESGVNQITASVERKVDDNLTLSLSHEQTLGSFENSDYPTTTTLGVDYRINKKTSVFATVSREAKNSGTDYKANAGLNYKISDSSNFRFAQVYETSKDSSRIYQNFAVDKLFKFSKNANLKVSYEKGIEYNSDNSDNNYNALNMALNYSYKDISSNLRLGFKVSDIEKKITANAGVYIKQSDALGLAFGADYYRVWSGNKLQQDINANFSFAYRPEMTNWILLDRFDYKDNLNKEQGVKEHTIKFINNLHLNYKPNDRLELGMHYGLKYVKDNIDGLSLSSVTDLLGLHAIYDINDKFALGAQASMLHSYSAKNLDYGAGVFMEYSPWKNSVITFGYNIVGFRDEDFAQQNNYRSGVYLQLKVKFDQGSIKEVLKHD